MKKNLRGHISKILKSLAVATIKKFQPEIIGITGSVGKTSTKNAVYSVLANQWSTRASRANFNTQIGLPLMILGSWSKKSLEVVSLKNQNKVGKEKIKKSLFFIRVIVASSLRLLLPRFLTKYPKILVLEYGAENPGDIKELLQIAKPRVGVVTALGDIPSHVEAYEDIEAVAREKARLVEALPASGGVVLNADDSRVMEMAGKTRARALTFGFSDSADVRITRFETKIDLMGRPEGISFKIEYNNAFLPVRIAGALGKPSAYAATSAVCVGIIHNMNIVEIADALADFKPQEQRMTLVDGVKKSLIIDDSYNASPISTNAALDSIATLQAKRKVLILGDMRELGKYSETAHKKVGERVGELCDFLITIGPKAETISQTAINKGFNADKTLHFDDVNRTKSKITPIIREGDLILVKASRSVGLEEVVEELRAK